MPDTPPKNDKSGPGTFRVCLHYAISHTCTLAFYVLYFVLLLASSGLAYIILKDDLPIPGILLQRIEAQLANRGMDITFRSAHLDPLGRILVNDLALAPRRFGEPVFAAEIAIIELDRIQLLAGIPALERLRAENVRIICPPALSPSGVSETVFELAGLDLRTNGERWTVDHLAAEFGPLHINAHGQIRIPRAVEGTPPPKLEELFDTYAKLAPDLARVREHLQTTTDPRLEISFEGATNTTIAINAVLTASGWRGVPEVEARGISVSANFVYDPQNPSPVDVRAGIHSLTYTDAVKAGKLEVEAHWDSLPTAEKPWPTRLTLNGARISHPKQDLISPAIVVDRMAWPEVDLRFHASLEGEPLEGTVKADVIDRSGVATIEGTFGKNWLHRASEILGRDVTYYATIGNPPDFFARVEFDPGLKWKQVDFRGTSGPLTARGVFLERATGRGTVTPEKVRVEHFEITNGDEHAFGTYEDNLRTRENRVHLAGTVRPLSISPWFSGWWANFWDDFTLHGPAPWFAVDVHGDWLRPKEFTVLGSARAGQGAYKGITFEGLDSRFFIRQDYYDIYDAALERAEGSLAGEVQIAYEHGNRIPVRESFDFESTADLVALAEIFGEGGRDMLAPYRYTTPPFAKVRGTVTAKNGVVDTDLAINIETDNEFRYHDFPMESLSADVTIKNSHVKLPRVRATYAGGTLGASAEVENGRLTYFATLTDANFADSLEIFSDFLDRTSPPTEEEKPATDPDDSLAAGLVGGKLNLQMTATGTVEDFQSYEGTGSMTVTDAELGKVKLFGLLADALGSIGLKVGVLNFHSAESTFEAKRERLIFPDMRITGDTGALELRGEYNLNAEDLDFRARLYPLRESQGALTQIFGVMLDPFSNFFEVRLTGSLSRPRWTPTLSALEIIRRATSTEPETKAQSTEGEADAAPPMDPSIPGAPEPRSNEEPVDNEAVEKPDEPANSEPPQPDQG